MSNVLTFTPRPRSAEPEAPPPFAVVDLRAHLEEAAQTALDAADKIIAALDHIDGGEAIRLREPPEPVEPIPSTTLPAEPDPAPEEIAAPAPEPIILPWRGAGNVVSAAGCAVLALVGMRA
jgi:hypothetical protein